MPALLGPDTPFPPLAHALHEPAGLLAVGADLSTERLRAAYARGIFPWYLPGEPILWWSPDPRMVLFTGEFKVSRSLAKKLRQIERTPHIEVRVDTAFDDVILACAAPRDYSRPATWITSPMQRAYREWHRHGQVHSVETWVDGALAGGLYGVGLGRMFYGESMFARAADASKIALAYLVRFLRRHGVEMIDCQQDTRHLASLGGRTIPRAEFERKLVEFTVMPELPWLPGRLYPDGTIVPMASPAAPHPV